MPFGGPPPAFPAGSTLASNVLVRAATAAYGYPIQQAGATIGIGGAPIGGQALTLYDAAGGYRCVDVGVQSGAGTIAIRNGSFTYTRLGVDGAAAYIDSVAGTGLRYKTAGVTRMDCSATQSAFAMGGHSPIAGTALSILAGGAANTQPATVGGRIAEQVTDVGNVGTGEDNLYAPSIAANTLNRDGRTLMVRGTVEVAGAPGGTTQTLKVKFGATTIFTLVIALGIKVEFGVRIIRTAAATQRTTYWWISSGGTADMDYGTAAETLSGAVTLAITGESATGAPANNDIVLHQATVDLEG